jgi:DMSO/TMAO reductase YedYZ heme-binding membrane subunit
VSPPLATIGPSVYWYLARGTGAVTLLLLTAVVVLGILGPLRVTGGRWPRFAIDTLHRDLSLLVIALLVVHIVTSVLDSFVSISLTAAVIPFISSYRPLWLGLGTVAFDILLALVITSLVRRRLGYQRWRLIHWLAYASLPIAVLHGLGTGSDAKIWWMLLLTAACVAVVVIATCVRVARAESAVPGLRVPALALSVLTPVALAVFALAGPLAHGWAARAGTPTKLLVHPAPVRVSTRAAAPPATSSPGTVTVAPFTAAITGTVRQSQAPGGALVDLNMHLSGGASGRLRVRLAGQPSPGGGLSMTGSQVDLLTHGTGVMTGQITSLQGTEFIAHVLNRAGALDLHARLNIDSQTNSVTGSVDASRAGGGQ